MGDIFVHFVRTSCAPQPRLSETCACVDAHARACPDKFCLYAISGSGYRDSASRCLLRELKCPCGTAAVCVGGDDGAHPPRNLVNHSELDSTLSSFSRTDLSRHRGGRLSFVVLSRNNFGVGGVIQVRLDGARVFELNLEGF